MNVLILPEALDVEDAAVEVFPYINRHNCLRGKVSLTKNTFSFLRAGRKEVISEERSVAIENDHFLLMKAGNCLMTETVSSIDQTYRSVLLFFSDEVLLEFLENHHVDTTRSPRPRAFQVSPYDAYLRRFVDSLDLLSRAPASLRQEMLPFKFQELMTYLLRRQGVDFLLTLLGDKNRRPDQLRDFIRVVESKQLEKLSVSELAFLCNMSLSTFKRTFLNHYGITPAVWFRERRLDHAAFLLRTSARRAADLYEAAGYENVSNFNQAFKRRFGLTPRQYGKQYLNL